MLIVPIQGIPIDFQEAVGRDLADGMTGLVAFHGVAQGLFNLAVVLARPHIDEIYDTTKEDTMLSMVGELYSRRMLPSLLVTGVYALPFFGLAIILLSMIFFYPTANSILEKMSGKQVLILKLVIGFLIL